MKYGLMALVVLVVPLASCGQERTPTAPPTEEVRVAPAPEVTREPARNTPVLQTAEEPEVLPPIDMEHAEATRMQIIVCKQNWAAECGNGFVVETGGGTVPWVYRIIVLDDSYVSNSESLGNDKITNTQLERLIFEDETNNRRLADLTIVVDSTDVRWKQAALRYLCESITPLQVDTCLQAVGDTSSPDPS